MDTDFAFAEQRVREVGERGEVARGANRAPRRDAGADLVLQQGHQGVDKPETHAGMAAGERDDLQQDHQAHDLVGQVFTHAGGVGTHQVPLQAREFVVLDPHLGEPAETGVHAVDGPALGDHLADGFGGFLDPAPGALAELDAHRRAPGPAQRGERYRRAVEFQSHRDPAPGAIGRSSPCSRAQSTASSYPASAWRMTPEAGSFQSTRSIRRSAASVPSQTMTKPACWE